MQSEESLLHIHLQVLSNTPPPTIPNTTLSAHFDKKKSHPPPMQSLGICHFPKLFPVQCIFLSTFDCQTSPVHFV